MARPITSRRSTRSAMQAHGMPGKLVTVCGIDGSGKTTTVAAIDDWMTERDIDHVVMKIPTEACRAIPYFRRYADDHTTAARGEVDLLSICLVCDADTLMLLRTAVLPLLAEGVSVVLDRYVYSSIAELLANDADDADIEAVLAVHGRIIRPDLPVIADAPVSEAVRRVRSRPDERDAKIDVALWERFAEGFRKAASDNDLFLLSTDCPPTESMDRLLPRLEAVFAREVEPA